jgi:hypothetical protein
MHLRVRVRARTFPLSDIVEISKYIQEFTQCSYQYVRLTIVKCVGSFGCDSNPYTHLFQLH